MPRILNSLTTTRETFVHALFMGNPKLTFREVNETIMSDAHKELWGVIKGEPKPLMMATIRLKELRDAAIFANQEVKNGNPIPPIPMSSKKRAKQLEALAEAVKEPATEVVSTEATQEATEVVVPTNDNATSDAVAEAV